MRGRHLLLFGRAPANKKEQEAHERDKNLIHALDPRD